MAKNHVATYQIRDMVRFIMYENKDVCNLLKNGACYGACHDGKCYIQEYINEHFERK